MKHWTRIEDPRITPSDVNECDECGYPRGRGRECETCERVRRLDEDEASDPEGSRRRKRERASY